MRCANAIDIPQKTRRTLRSVRGERASERKQIMNEDRGMGGTGRVGGIRGKMRMIDGELR